MKNFPVETLAETISSYYETSDNKVREYFLSHLEEVFSKTELLKNNSHLMPTIVSNLFFAGNGKEPFVHFFNFIKDKIQQNSGSYAAMLKNILEQLQCAKDSQSADLITASIVEIISPVSEHFEKIFKPSSFSDNEFLSQRSIVLKIKDILKRLAEFTELRELSQHLEIN